MEAQLIKPDGTIVDIVPKNGKDFKLDELYELIGCEMIELLALRNKKFMIIDEEGKLKPNPIVNIVATKIYSLDTIVGNAVVCDRKLFK